MLQIWDVGRTPREVGALIKHNAAVLDLLFHSNNIVSVDRGGSARVWVRREDGGDRREEKRRKETGTKEEKLKTKSERDVLILTFVVGLEPPSVYPPHEGPPRSYWSYSCVSKKRKQKKRKKR